jgi:hypothetical protein
MSGNGQEPEWDPNEAHSFRDWLQRIDSRTMETMQALGHMMREVALVRADVAALRRERRSPPAAPPSYHRSSDGPPPRRRFDSLLNIEDDDPTGIKSYKDELRQARRSERLKNIGVFIGAMLGTAAVTAASIYAALHGH